jgi:hypothetical protein
VLQGSGTSGPGEDGQPGTALVQQVRQLHSTVGALLPPLVKIADRD